LGLFTSGYQLLCRTLLYYRAKDLLFMGILVKVFLIGIRENLDSPAENLKLRGLIGRKLAA